MQTWPAVIADGLSVRGEISGAPDLVIEGRFEGRIQLEQTLTVEASGSVEAEIDAEVVVIAGRVAGRVRARTRIEIRASAAVFAELSAPRIAIEDGAAVEGRFEMPATGTER